MIIRAVESEDVAHFQNIMRASIRALCAEAYGAQTVAAWTAVDNPVFHFSLPEFAFIAEDEGGIQAVDGWSLTDRVDLHPIRGRTIENPTHVRINAVYIKPGCEGQGLGRKIVTHLEADIMRRTQIRDIYLWATKNAIPFYEAMGFKPGQDQYPQVAEGYEIMIRYMWKTLA